MSTFMIGFYGNRSFSLYNRFFETSQINNQTIIHVVNICYKEVPANISYPNNINKIGGYMDGRISLSSVRYIITRDKQISTKRGR